MQESIFTKIINGSVPSHKVYEDDHIFAFLDIYPIQPGQILVVPRHPVSYVWDMSEDEYTRLMLVVRLLAHRLREAFPEKSHVGVHIEGLEVAHAHVKLFPFSSDEEFRHHPDMQAEPDHARLAALAEKLRS